MPFETVYGLSVRRFSSARHFEQLKTVQNVALFGRPVEAGSVRVTCMNRLILRRVKYEFEFGPTIDLENLRQKGHEQAQRSQEQMRESLAASGMDTEGIQELLRLEDRGGAVSGKG